MTSVLIAIVVKGLEGMRSAQLGLSMFEMCSS